MSDFFTASSTKTKQPPISESKVKKLQDEMLLWDYIHSIERVANKEFLPVQKAIMFKQWHESGKPHIRTRTERETWDDNVAAGWEPEHEFPNRMGNKDKSKNRRHYSSAEMTFGKTHDLPDTLLIPDKPYSYLGSKQLASLNPEWTGDWFGAEWMEKNFDAELAHSFHKKYTKLLPVDPEQIDIEEAQFDAYNKKISSDWKEHGYDRYSEPEAFEHQVHSWIQPALKDEKYPKDWNAPIDLNWEEMWDTTGLSDALENSFLYKSYEDMKKAMNKAWEEKWEPPTAGWEKRLGNE
tara:strand:- start:241 stop:1122 length:882 start_codon:yes stop_codon:yes gene_type:complete